MDKLKIILKTDSRNSMRESVSAIREEFNDEIEFLQIGIGDVKKNDVELVMAAPEHTIIVGFNVGFDNEVATFTENNVIHSTIDQVIECVRSHIKKGKENG